MLKRIAMASCVVCMLLCGGCVNDGARRSGSRGGGERRSAPERDGRAEGAKKWQEWQLETARGIRIPCVKVYMENTKSMDGYVSGGAQFKETVYRYLTDLQVSGACDSLSLNYINSRLLPQQEDLSAYVKNLTPASFSAKRDLNEDSDCNQQLGGILSWLEPRDVAIYISDCVLSPGSQANASDFVLGQEVDLMRRFTMELSENPSLGVVVYQLDSEFSGEFFNRENSRGRLEGVVRPYYIWLIGPGDALSALEAHAQPGGSADRRNRFVATLGSSVGGCEVLGAAGKRGTVDVDRRDKSYIRKAKPDGRGDFQFTLGVNLNGLSLLGYDYLLDEENYEVISEEDYRLRVLLDKTGQKYTHWLQVSWEGERAFRKTTVGVRLQRRFPSWVSGLNDDEGLVYQQHDDPAALRQTYGINALLQGVWKAYTTEARNRGNSETYAEFKVGVGMQVRK